MTATVAAVAFVVSCSNHLKVAEQLDLAKTPVQVIDNMVAVESQNGALSRRVESDKMERYENDTTTIEIFIGDFSLYSYNSEGLLETVILSDKAQHVTYTKKEKEYWLLTGCVSLQNVVKQETAETDSLYWDRKAERIYTDSYVKMYSADGLMQGFGLQAEEDGSNAVIGRPFNSYSVVVQDTTRVVVDSVNFIGPLFKK